MKSTRISKYFQIDRNANPNHGMNRWITENCTQNKSNVSNNTDTVNNITPCSTEGILIPILHIYMVSYLDVDSKQGYYGIYFDNDFHKRFHQTVAKQITLVERDIHTEYELAIYTFQQLLTYLGTHPLFAREAKRYTWVIHTNNIELYRFIMEGPIYNSKYSLVERKIKNMISTLPQLSIQYQEYSFEELEMNPVKGFYEAYKLFIE